VESDVLGALIASVIREVMAAVSASETSVIPEDSLLHTRRRENLTSYPAVPRGCEATPFVLMAGGV
jgi:hypothetical protein